MGAFGVAVGLAAGSLDWSAVPLLASDGAPLFSPSWYRQTMFDSYHEVHALQLGIYAGILALALRARGYRHAATATLVGLFVFSFGVPDVYAVCQRTGEACGSLPVQLKPWYFLTGLLGTAVVAPRLGARVRWAVRAAWSAVRGLRSPPGGTARARDAASPGTSRDRIASADGGRPRGTEDAERSAARSD